jgi:GxxExxY protein
MTRSDFREQKVLHSIIGSFYEVYNNLGYGFLERAYELALQRELKARSHSVILEMPMLIMYKGEPLLVQRIDMLVDARIVVEIKSSESLHAGSTRQVYNYLRATGLEVGLLLHFGPRPRFYRVFCRRSASDEKHSPHSEHEDPQYSEDFHHSEHEDPLYSKDSADPDEDQGVVFGASGSNTNLA